MDDVTYDAILFDMDGVLVTGYETDPAVYRRATEQVIRAFGRSPEDIEWSMGLENPDAAKAFREACTELHFHPDAAWGYRERAAAALAYERMHAGERPAFNDTQVLSTLADSYLIGVCSNNRHATVGDYIDLFDWGEVVGAYRGRYPTLTDFDRRKPDPLYLRWVIEQLDSHSPLFIGDRMSDVQTAERVGCDAALLTREGSSPPGPQEPRYHIQSLTELVELDESGWYPHQ